MNREPEHRQLIEYTVGVDEKGNGHYRQYYVSTHPKFFRRKSKGWCKRQGYIVRRVVNHKHAERGGYMLEHRLVMEEKLGRFLIPKKEVVHHLDGDRSNNHINNLILTSLTEHPKGHIGERNPNGQFACIDPVFQEIKFRLRNTSTGETRPYTLSELIGITHRKGQFEFRGRFTGLLDKNGVDLDWWEGDTLDWCDEIGSIIFSDGSFWFSPKDIPDEWEYMHMLADDCANIKKIGHIHEEQK